MDSLSQIVLGAACGEAVLGKKIGNRAMIWGAVAGTLPDLDVTANLFLDPIQALGFHRGPMHSILFAIVVPFIIGPLVKNLYDKNWHTKKTWKIAGYCFGILFFLLIATIISSIWSMLFEGFPLALVSLLVISAALFFYLRFKQVFYQQIQAENASTKEWILLFFWAIFTHPLLDSFTTYGTVLFWPFSNMRISLSTISIVDPLYTIPFAIFLLITALYHRDHKHRSVFNWIGISLSTSYLIFTIFHKQHINSIFEKSLQSENIPYKEYITVPTIFNNLLWYAIAKQDTSYVYSYYSVLDKEKKFISIKTIPANHQHFTSFRNQTATNLLPWFSDGYYNLIRLNDTLIQYNDLRFGSMSGTMEKKDDYIFKFYLADKKGTLEMEKERTRPQNSREDIEWFKKRITGVLRTEEK